MEPQGPLLKEEDVVEGSRVSVPIYVGGRVKEGCVYGTYGPEERVS